MNLLYARQYFSQRQLTSNEINFDLSNLVKWFRANKVALNVNKIDIVTFRSPRKQTNKKMNFRLSGHKIRRKTFPKYLGLLLYEHLHLKTKIE